MPRTATEAAFVRLVQWLCDDEVAAQVGYAPTQLSLRGRVSEAASPISPRELEAFFAKNVSRGTLSDWRRFIFLRMIHDEGVWWLPVMTLKYDLDVPEVRLRLGLFRFDAAGGSRLQAFGFRIETPDPEQPQPGFLGKHTFCHVQLIRELDPGLGLALPNFDWVPTEQPSMPVRADNYIQMCVSGIVALYGGLRVAQIPEHVAGLLIGELQKMGWA